ncbi:CKL4 [Symbiodinium microadriaticum]|nr:CKL4 [Symbiodinium microadriaticum]
MSKSTVHWSPGEASLGRASLNSILGGIHNRLDVTEEMMKAATIGRSSELGPNWEPPGMVSRKIASILTEGGRRPDDDSAKSHREVAQYMKAIQAAGKKEPPRITRLAEESRRPAQSHSEPRLPARETPWRSMLPRRAPSAALLAAGTAAAAPQTGKASNAFDTGKVPKRAPLSWQPKEPSLARDSFNAMTQNQNLDVTEVMMRNAMMGKAAMMGPEWDPPGIVSRKIAEAILFPEGVSFRSVEEQERYVAKWCRDRAGMDPDKLPITFRWYEANYVEAVRSIFPSGDNAEVLADCEKDVLVLEEPEHLCWYHNGPSCFLGTMHEVPDASTRKGSRARAMPWKRGPSAAQRQESRFVFAWLLLDLLIFDHAVDGLEEEPKFTLGKRLGHGSFGQVFLAKDVQTGEDLAVKVEHPVGKHSSLTFEARVLKRFSAPGFPRIHSLGKEGCYHLLAMELLGPSIEATFNKCGRKFGLKTLLMMAEQMVRLLEYVHMKGYVHRDIKPENFLIGRGDRRNVVHLIDFGLAKRLDPERPRLGPRRSLVGTARYASICAHEGAEQGCKDDLEALAYVLIYLALGELPWQGIQAESKEEKHEKIMELKQQISVEELCKDCHDVFARFLRYTQGLKFQEKPDYTFIYRLFRDTLSVEGLENDGQLDWLALPEKTVSASRSMSSSRLDAPNQGRSTSRNVEKGGHRRRERSQIKRQVTPGQSAKTLCTSTKASSRERETVRMLLLECERLWIFYLARWTELYRHVIGVVHTNYQAYLEKMEYEGLMSSATIRDSLFSTFTTMVCSAYCDVTIKLSSAGMSLPNEVKYNVHGVRKEFFEGARRADVKRKRLRLKPQKSANQVYFIGKAVKPKGWVRLIKLLGKLPAGEGWADFAVEGFGSGADAEEIQAMVKTLNEERKTGHPIMHMSAGLDHADKHFDQYKVLLNPSTTEMLCTVTAEALALGKRVVLPDHSSNAYFKANFADRCHFFDLQELGSFEAALQEALGAEGPTPLLAEAEEKLRWETASERFYDAAQVHVLSGRLSRPSEARGAKLAYELHSRFQTDTPAMSAALKSATLKESGSWDTVLESGPGSDLLKRLKRFTMLEQTTDFDVLPCAEHMTYSGPGCYDTFSKVNEAAAMGGVTSIADCVGENELPKARRLPPSKLRGGFMQSILDSDACGFHSRCDCAEASFSGERQKYRMNKPRRDSLLEELFAAHDLNKNGLLEELELIQLNKKIVLLHYGRNADLDAVKSKYQDIFRRNLSTTGEPVNFPVFRDYLHQVLNSIDPDPTAQEMILEQWLAEAQAARLMFHMPSVMSVSDLPFLSTISFDQDDLEYKPSSRRSVDTASTTASVSMPVTSTAPIRCTSFVHAGPPTEDEKAYFRAWTCCPE